ncbi:hypothetical protein REPUB_Repub02eG0214600 [Reevesia pubescens]
MEGVSVCQIKNVCIFCGSNLRKDEEFVKIANNLGRVLVKKNICLVYGGGSLGLMGFVATAAHLGGNEVFGVIPKALATRNIAGKIVGDEIMVSWVHERMNIMIENVDVFIALPGGFRTMKEIFQIVSWAQLNIHQKPIGLLNVNGFYDSLFSFLDHAMKYRFISQATHQILVNATNPNQLLNQLQVFVPKSDPALALLD